MSQNPTIAVLVSIFNGERYLAECLRSVETQLQRGDQLLIHDDGSTDKTSHILQAWPHPLDYSHAPNQGISRSRNLLARRATADFLIFLDGDDLLASNSLEVIREHIRTHPSDCVLTPIRFFYDADRSKPDHVFFSDARAVVDDPLGFFLDSMPPAASLVVCHNAFERVGGFRPLMRHSEEFDLVVRLCLAGVRWTYQPVVVRSNRLHQGVRASHNQRLCSWKAITVVHRLYRQRYIAELSDLHREKMLDMTRAHGRILFRLGAVRPARAALHLADCLARTNGWQCKALLDWLACFLGHYNAEYLRQCINILLRRDAWGNMAGTTT